MHSFCTALDFWINFSRSEKKTSFLFIHLIEILVTLNKILHLGIKNESFILYCSRFLVTLQEFSAFLCIKAVWGIEEKLGYELETVLNSTFCYEMHSMNTRC